ncbi:hypothetical protein [Roseateles sp.]|uniref:hypothetical protein n=1 Tax=Roseateles sp. TaxID=1971397 RepID=UPI003BA5364E
MSKLTAFLSGCTATATAIIAITLLTGAKAPPTKFEEIDVGRINVREPDGTLRMVISNRTQFPGAPWKGQEIPRPDRRSFAGMLFVNDEGTESGGLIQKGSLGANGKADAGLSLTFDRFRQDQVLQLLHAEQGGQAMTHILINDEPSHELMDVKNRMARFDEIDAMKPPERRLAMQEMRDKGLMPANRVRLGTTQDKASALSLADAQGRTRMLLIVSADGKPSIQMLDEQGKVAKTIGLDTP